MSTPTPGPRGLLILEGLSGQKPLVFPGLLFGASVTAKSLEDALKGKNPAGRDKGYGEVVFNTCMTGYQEVLTDPSYYGQMVVMTVAHIGNTGVNSEDVESGRPWASGFVVHANCFHSSNWRKKDELDSFLKKHGIPAIQAVDTRALTVALRSQGVVRGLIVPELEKDRALALLSLLPRFEGRDLLKEVTTREAYAWRGDGDTYLSPRAVIGARRFKVVAVDYGVKWNLLRSLAARGCDLEVVPAGTTAQEILGRKPDGVFLSNGPGDPAAATYAVEAVRGVLGKVPVFGVCMGHQILSLALGGKTYKLKFGHHGGNQPVLDKRTGKVEISSQNHGYAVDPQSLPKDVEVTHTNLNDRTVEGLAAPHLRAFSVQYHPEASPGPQDSDYLFDQFIAQMGGQEAGRPEPKK